MYNIDKVMPLYRELREYRRKGKVYYEPHPIEVAVYDGAKDESFIATWHPSQGWQYEGQWRDPRFCKHWEFLEDKKELRLKYIKANCLYQKY